MTSCARSLAVAVLLSVTSLALAERPPEERSEAKMVLVGTVKEITTRQSKLDSDGVMTHYLAQVAVKKVERGKGVKTGGTAYVRWFAVTKTPGEDWVGAGGHSYRIKSGDKARFYLMNQSKGAWEVIYSHDGVQKLTR